MFYPILVWYQFLWCSLMRRAGQSFILMDRSRMPHFSWVVAIHFSAENMGWTCWISKERRLFCSNHKEVICVLVLEYPRTKYRLLQATVGSHHGRNGGEMSVWLPLYYLYLLNLPPLKLGCWEQAWFNNFPKNLDPPNDIKWHQKMVEVPKILG